MGRAVRGSIQRNGARVQGVRQDLAPASFTKLVQFAQMAAKSQLVPKEYRHQPEDIMLGRCLPGLCKASPVYHDIIETFAELLTAVCIAKRHGSTPVTARFSVMDAKRAGLWTKAVPGRPIPDGCCRCAPAVSPSATPFPTCSRA
jgi:hypothetical protein